MNYEHNLSVIQNISCEYDGKVYWMNRGSVYGIGVSLGDVSTTKSCGICRFWKGTRGIGVSGMWIFKKFGVYMEGSEMCSKCSIDGNLHDITKKDDPEECGYTCKHFETILPQTFDNLPNTAFDITR